MVSGFLTSPWLHSRISSAVASPILSWSKKFTSSTGHSKCCVERRGGSGGGRSLHRPPAEGASDLLDAAGLAAGQVDAELLGGAEDVLLRVAKLEHAAVSGEHLDIEAKGLHLLDQ